MRFRAPCPPHTHPPTTHTHTLTPSHPVIPQRDSCGLNAVYKRWSCGRRTSCKVNGVSRAISMSTDHLFTAGRLPTQLYSSETLILCSYYNSCNKNSTIQPRVETSSCFARRLCPGSFLWVWMPHRGADALRCNLMWKAELK